MTHPVIHAEIRSQDPDATRAFFTELFGWTYTDGAFPGYTFVDPGVEGALPTAIGPLQGEGVAAAVTVRNDPTHGMLAAVCITASAGASREAIVKRCSELLGGFQIRHDVEFAPGAT